MKYLVSGKQGSCQKAKKGERVLHQVKSYVQRLDS